MLVNNKPLSLYDSSRVESDGFEVHENKLGAFKLEGIIDKAVFLGPKTYAALLRCGKIKIKGLNIYKRILILKLLYIYYIKI